MVGLVTMVGALVALPAALGSSAAAQPPPGPHGHGGGGGWHHGKDGKGIERMERRVEKMAEELGLDPRRRASISRIVKNARSRAEGLRAQKQKARARLHELMQAEGSREADVVEAARRVGQIETDLRVLKVRTMFSIRGLLTPEERQRLRDLRSARVERIQQACAADFAAHCAGAEHPRDKRQCLKRNRHQLSASCQQALPRHRRGAAPHPRP